MLIQKSKNRNHSPDRLRSNIGLRQAPRGAGAPHLGPSRTGTDGRTAPGRSGCRSRWCCGGRWRQAERLLTNRLGYIYVCVRGHR